MIKKYFKHPCMFECNYAHICGLILDCEQKRLAKETADRNTQAALTAMEAPND